MRSILSITLTAALLAGTPPALQAEIYKTVNEDGNVVYTDVPPKDSSAAMDVDRGNTYTPPSPVTPNTPAQERTDDATLVEVVVEQDDKQPAVTSYMELSITAPGHDQAVRENAGNLTITVTSIPALDATLGHQVQILLDGQNAATGGVTLSLTNVDRGTHALTARIIDANGEVLISSTPVTFHMLRYSRLQKKPAARAAN